MVVVSHLFFFFDKKFGESVTRYESHPPSLELSISRQPLSFCIHNPYKSAHFPYDIQNVQVEVNTLPMIQFIQGYFALK